jgi:glycosyltransferase involved in cell wall biosynthesis
VVASETGIFRKVIEESDAGYLAPVDDVAHIAAALRNLMTEPETASVLGFKGSKYISQLYSTHHESAGICSSYQILWAQSAALQ